MIFWENRYPPSTDAERRFFREMPGFLSRRAFFPEKPPGTFPGHAL